MCYLYLWNVSSINLNAQVISFVLDVVSAEDEQDICLFTEINKWVGIHSFIFTYKVLQKKRALILSTLFPHIP